MNNEFYLADAIDVIEEVLQSGGDFRLFPKGTSMLPLIVQGKDSVVLRRRFDGGLKKNEIAFYRRTNGQFVLHRIAKVEKNGTYTMCGDNQTELEYGITQSQIIGYVADIYKNESLLKMDSFKYKFYVAFWCCIPFRRVLRFPRRCLSKIKRIFLKMFKKAVD